VLLFYVELNSQSQLQSLNPARSGSGQIWKSEIRYIPNHNLNISNSSQPACLCSLLSYHIPARSLCSSNSSLLTVPWVCTTFASHSFSVAAPSVWSSLSSGIRTCLSLHTFCRLLKTYCFEHAFSSHERRVQVPHIWPLTDTAHCKSNYLLT